MEEVSTRTSPSDDYGSSSYGAGSLCNSLLEPTVHDVMSMEMGHHDLGGNYLDPRSFGGVVPFDDYSVHSAAPQTSMYDLPSNSYDHTDVHSQYTTHSQHGQDGELFGKLGPSQHQQPPSSQQSQPRYDVAPPNSTAPPPPTSQRSVPTYPVKTANPATCTQYAPVRTVVTMKPPPRRSSSSRTAQKKEPLDPKRVEDEVARNVSQILSATKQQRLVQEAQQRCGIISQPPRLSFCCPDCGKSMTSQRNLQRHRQASCTKKMTDSPEPSQLSCDSGNGMGTLPGMDTFAHGMTSFAMHSEASDWCSTDSFSPSHSLSRGRLDSNEQLDSHGLSDACMAPLSLETDDSCTRSSSPSHSSSTSNGHGTPNAVFTCGSCKKSVCSFRSLKRHHTTCKQYIAEFGPPDSDRNKPKKTVKRRSKKKSVPSDVILSTTTPSPPSEPTPTPRPRSSSTPHLIAALNAPLQCASNYPPPIRHVSVADPWTPNYLASTLPARSSLRMTSPTDTMTSPGKLLLMTSAERLYAMTSAATAGLITSAVKVETMTSAVKVEMMTSEDRKDMMTSAVDLHTLMPLVPPPTTVATKRLSFTEGFGSRAPSRSSSTEDTEEHATRIPRPPGTHNTCVDCNRQLCSASNLKRHRATCKVALQRVNGSGASSVGASPPAPPVPPTPPMLVDLPDSDRSIIDRSYAAALAASEEARFHPVSNCVVSEAPSQNRPWFQMTVGEHLRAQHVHQQKLIGGSGISTGQLGDEEETTSYAPPVDQKVMLEPLDTKVRCNDNAAMETKPLRQEETMEGQLLQNQDQEQSLQQQEEEKETEKKEEEKSEGDAYLTTTEHTDACAKEEYIDWAKRDQLERKPFSEDIRPLDSIITTQPLTSDRMCLTVVQSEQQRRSLPAAQPAPPTQLTPIRSTTASNSTEFQCPECKKTYSCRKNVKRHRMAVHKLTAEDVARYPGPTPCASAVPAPATMSLQMSSQSYRTAIIVPKVDSKVDFTTESHPLPPAIQPPTQPPQIRYHAKPISEGVSPLWGHSRESREYVDDEESAETARIAAELKRSAEQEMAEIEEKKPRTELAEADSTFCEDGDSLARSQHSSPGSATGQPVSSSLTSPGVPNQTSTLPAISSWIDAKRTDNIALSVDIPGHIGVSRSANSSPVFRVKRPPHVCDKCNRVLSSDYSLRRHRQNCTEQRGSTSSAFSTEFSSGGQLNLKQSADPMIGHGASSAGRTLSDEDWLKREEVPDSTTSQRLDRSTSPGVLMDQGCDAPGLGGLPYTRKRALSGGPAGGSNSPFMNDPKQARHLCQACGKFYSSEWNLERHRRESCPTKTGESSSSQVSDDVSVLLGTTRFVLSRAALSRASSSFVQLFTVHDPSKGELRLDIDPQQFQSLLDVYNNPSHLSPTIVDGVVALAEKLKFNSVFECCTKYIADELPKCSVMHAIRLAEQYRLLSIKQKLFDSISIDVFRSLAADHHYKLMNAELKAELLEKWGTFL